MNPIKRLAIAGIFVVAGLVVLELFAYDVIKINWISFMQIQPSFQPMENPLPVPQDSIPVEGAAFIPGMGAPVNPVSADQVSIARGAELYQINCSLCHGPQGIGNGSIATYLTNKPVDLTSLGVQSLSDGAIFMIVSVGVPGKMPALNENLLVRERWDVVNYVRTLKK